MKKLFLLLSITFLFVSLQSCKEIGRRNNQPQSTTGVKKATAEIVTQSNGLTIEQESVKERLEIENLPGSIKHLYILSAYSGQTILYSTVKGKVTSSGKRLTPQTVVGSGSDMSDQDGIPITIAGKRYHTTEVLGDDGTYGSSIPYLYWWDAKGIYHQHYVSGGQILHVSNQPIKASGVILSIESE